MNLNVLPIEILLKIFDYSQVWLNLMLVCKKWKSLIDEFHVFGKFTYFQSDRSKEAPCVPRRKFRDAEFLFSEATLLNIQLFMEHQPLIEEVTLILSELKSEVDFIRLLTLMKNVRCLKIYIKCLIEVEEWPNKTIDFENLKRLEVCYRGEYCETIDSFLCLINAPNIEDFRFKTRESILGLRKFGSSFIDRHPQLKL